MPPQLGDFQKYLTKSCSKCLIVQSCMLNSHGFMQKESAASVAKFMTSSLSNRYNLAMVAGSNHLLTFLDTKKENRVRVLVRPSKKRRTDLKGYFECVKQYSGLFAGATYKVNGLEGFTREIWICPVTLTVLGHYPQYIYIKQMTINN